MRLVKSFFIGMLTLLVVSCGPSASEQAEALASVEAEVAQGLAEKYEPSGSETLSGYKYLGDGIIARPMSDDEKKENPCSLGKCASIVIKAKKDCPDGVYIEVAGYDASDALVGRGNEKTAGMDKGEIAKLAIWLSDGSRFKVKEVNCY